MVKRGRNLEKWHQIFLRYALALVLSFKELYIFYLIFTPLTLYLSLFILKLFYEVSITGNLLLVNGSSLEFVRACVAGGAYYLLLALNLTTPHIKAVKRVKIFLFTSLLLLAMNVLRVVILSSLFIQSSIYFEITHKIFWFFVSTLYVLLIWILAVRIFRIKDIPVYSDFLSLWKSVRKRK